MMDIHQEMIVARQTSFIDRLGSQLPGEDAVVLEARKTFLWHELTYGEKFFDSVFYQRLHMGVDQSWSLQEQFKMAEHSFRARTC